MLTLKLVLRIALIPSKLFKICFGIPSFIDGELEGLLLFHDDKDFVAEGILPVSTSEHSMRRQCSKNLCWYQNAVRPTKKFTVLVPIHPLENVGHQVFISIFLPFPLDIFGCFQILSASFRNTHSIDASFCSSAQVELQGWLGSDGSGQRGSKLTIIAIIILLTLDNWKKTF